MVETGSLRVLDILANASAVIAEGEVLQLTVAANLATDEATYLEVVRGKTAALFAAACEVGGVIAGAPEPQVVLAVVAAEPGGGEGQERPQPLAAGLDQMRRHLGDARGVLARHPLADQRVDPLHVVVQRRLQVIDRGARVRGRTRGCTHQALDLDGCRH